MKSPLSKKVLAKEASFWTGLKKAMSGNSGKLCHK